ncbi:hypothetical protein CRENBAI_023414, partial [Crenichthys baileyi]
ISRDQSIPSSTPASPPAQTMQTLPTPLPQTELGPASGTRTQTQNQNPNWNHPGPNDAYPHPRPTFHLHYQKKTYTHPNIQTTPTTHKTLDTQVDSVPPPPTDPLPHQQNAFLEGESTCNEMVPTHQFMRPLSPPMHRRRLG